MEKIHHGMHIALSIKSGSMENFKNLQKLLKTKTGEYNNIKRVSDPHITLDFLGQSTLDKGEEKLTHVQEIVSKSSQGLEEIHGNTIQYFVSNQEEGKYIIYLAITGGEYLFQSLRDGGYSLQTPHITLCEIPNTNIDKNAIESIILSLNQDDTVKQYIDNIHINTGEIELRYKHLGTTTSKRIVLALS